MKTKTIRGAAAAALALAAAGGAHAENQNQGQTTLTYNGTFANVSYNTYGVQEGEPFTLSLSYDLSKDALTSGGGGPSGFDYVYEGPININLSYQSNVGFPNPEGAIETVVQDYTDRAYIYQVSESGFNNGHPGPASITQTIKTLSLDFVSESVGSESLGGGYKQSASGNLSNYLGKYADLVVSPAPEPSTWALMLAGVAGIGLMLRRPRRTPAFT